MRRAVLGAAIAASVGSATSHAIADDAATAAAEARLRATYPMGALSTSTFAGVDLALIAIPRLHLETRDDRPADRGGITLGFADDHGVVRVVVRVAVARDAVGARAFAQGVLRGVAGVLAPSSLDEVSFADEGGRGEHFVVAARGNVAYVVDAQDGAPPAHAIAALVQKAIVKGTPSFPQAHVTLPPSIDHADRAGAPITVVVPSGATYRVHARGGYVTRGARRAGDLLHAHAAGPVEVTAVVVDSLGRVTEARVAAVAR